MPKSLNRYIEPKTGAILVDVGDELTPDVVEALGRAGAERVRFENLPFAQQMLLSHRQGLLLGIGEEEDKGMQEPMPDHISGILTVLVFAAGYSALMLLAIAIDHYRYWWSRRKEEEDKDAPN